MCVSSNIILPLAVGAATGGVGYLAGGLGATAAIASGLSAAASTGTAVASVQSAKANVAAAKTEQSELQAEAQSTRESASYEAEQKIEQAKQARSKAAVQYASSGINPNTGTASNVQQDIMASGTSDMLNITNNAARKAWGLELSGQEKVTQAKSELSSAYTSGASGVLANIASTALKFA